jgi:hypothetical protein
VAPPSKQRRRPIPMRSLDRLEPALAWARRPS